ncbi:RCC1/BLIP-II [Tothia fuscella]|uniref:RCC1/BLIP-II n=1 Tax=Tothia fuscella TaxID=1048955 RepID=A0A9P4TZR3_9PEZI|nr:RCC1/BLIP-II [Tothia fuscella]
MLFALGSNGSGQLGIGHKEDVNIPTPCLVPDGFQGSSVLSIKAGGNHTLLQMPGEVFAAGDNSNGCYTLISRDSSNSDNHKFRVAAVSTGHCSATWEASTIVDNVDRVFTSGTGKKGELGHGEGVTELLEAKMVKNFPPSDHDESIVDLAASMSHTVAVLLDGSVFGWGAGRKGQLGLPALDSWTPRPIDNIPFEVYRAVCGKEFTYLVGSPESGDHKIIGSDKHSIISDAPKTLPPWKDVGASWGSICVLLQSGEILSWGRNDHGQLAPPGIPKIKQIAVGSEHFVALTEDGRVISWGWGEHGNCGSPIDEAGDVKRRWNELSIEGEVTMLGAGCATTFIATADPVEWQ